MHLLFDLGLGLRLLVETLEISCEVSLRSLNAHLLTPQSLLLVPEDLGLKVDAILLPG